MSNIATYRRTHPLMNYLLVLFACVGCYLLYLQFVVPVVEVTGKIERGFATGSFEYAEPPQDTEHYVWFGDQDWERSPCSVLRTAHGKILFDDYSREDPKTWLVHPFTMLLEREADPESGKAMPPIILRCQTGARLHFAKPVASVGGNSFQLERAQLEGSVELYRRVSANSEEEDIRIETSNIQINESQILSIDDVAFRFGNNQGVGRHLTMQLRHHGNDNQVNSDISQISGISSIRLGILSSMLLKPKRKTVTRSDRLLSHDQSPIEVTSRGPFEFDFQTNLARFIDQVRVRKMDPSGDSLACDELILQFKSDSKNQSVALDSASDQEFELENIVAVGAPAVLNAKSQNARISGKTLDYNLATQTIQVSDEHRVEVLKDGDRFVCKTIQYQINNDKRLGDLDAIGPGQLTRKKGDDQFTASWSEGLRIRRQADREHLIQLRGKSSLQLDSKTNLEADQIDISIWEVPVYDQNHKFVRWSYQPKQLHAIQKVHVAAEKLIANSKTLKVSWPENPQMITLPPIRVGRSRMQNSTFAANLNSAIQNSANNLDNMADNTHPDNFSRQILNRPNYDSKPNKLPVVAQGDSIEIIIIEKDGKSEVTDLELAGNVTVQQPRRKNRRPEFEVIGDHLRMVPIGDDLFEIKVSATSEKMAQAFSDKLKLSGEQLFLNQVKNSMWVKGQGRVKLVGNDLRADSLNVSFSGGMIFDGRKVYFERDVVADIRQPKLDSTSLTRASGTALSITLDQEIKFQEVNQSDSQDKPKVIDMTFIQYLPKDKTKFHQASFANKSPAPVVIQNKKMDLNNKIIEQLTLQSHYANLNEKTSKLIADGPGYVQIYRRSIGNRGARGFGFVGSRNGKNSPLTYIQTNFDKQLVANQNTDELVILGNLRSIYSPADNFNQSFNPDQATQLVDGAIRLNCDRIDLIRSNNSLSPRPESQFIASGNAHIQSNTIDTIADRISYRDDSDILTVESVTGKNVVLKMRQDVRSSWQKIEGQELIYRVADKTARVRKFGNVSASFGTGQ